MKKFLLLTTLFLVNLFGYITTDNSQTTTGVMPDSVINSAIGSCSANCSTVWHYNATTTKNLKDNDVSQYFNKNIVSTNTLKVDKNLTMTAFINKGLAFFKEQSAYVSTSYSEKLYTGYNVFMVVREVADTNSTSTETITKKGNDFSVTNSNKENTTMYLNSENIFDSFLFGQVDTNSGLVSAYTYRNRIVNINNKKYHFIELEKVNFLNSLVNKYNEFCSHKENFNFPFIYEPSKFFYNYTSIVTGVNLVQQNLSSVIYPSTIPVDGAVKTGLISIPCNSYNIGTDPYASILKMKIFLDENQVTFYNGYTGFTKTDLISNVENYFYDGGFSLKIANMVEKNILNSALSFFTGIMQENRLESGIVVKSNQLTINNDYWKDGKCPTHYNKKTITNESEAYFLSSLNYEMPFNESSASFDVSNSLKISSYSPISAFPNSMETVYALTPDNHILSHSVSNSNNILDSVFNNNKNSIGTSGFTSSYDLTRTYAQKCKSFGIFTFILVIIAIIVTIYTGGLAAGLWTEIMVGATTTATGFTAAGTALLGITASNALMVAAFAGYIAYSLYPNIWTGVDTSPTSSELANASYSQILEAKLTADAIQSGSSYYMNFINLKNTLNQTTSPTLGISPKNYNTITANSYMYDSENVTQNQYSILGFNTTKELNHLYAITYSHAEPATLPPKFRYYNYSKVAYVPKTLTTYDITTVPNSSGGNEMLNISILENSFLNDMYGYNDGTNQLNVFHTKDIMINTLEKLNKNNIKKYDK